MLNILRHFFKTNKFTQKQSTRYYGIWLSIVRNIFLCALFVQRFSFDGSVSNILSRLLMTILNINIIHNSYYNKSVECTLINQLASKFQT
jgi:hypothetical protein